MADPPELIRPGGAAAGGLFGNYRTPNKHALWSAIKTLREDEL